MIILYTQPQCPYCDMMKQKLRDAHVTFSIIDISKNADAKNFLKGEGHKTVPQLYANDVHINKKNTEEYTPEELLMLLQEAELIEWTWQDSGIEEF